ncbi:MAG: hypothetical protein K2J63_02390 [Muribaculaceae bacterium]|nr:hypothetical protein [Muribaculaceae bacterium]
MELDGKNISRLYRISIHKLHKNRLSILKKTVVYIYLYGSFIALSAYCACNIGIAVKPLGWFFVTMVLLGLYFLYVLLNHILIRYWISHKILLIFETLLLATLIILYMTQGLN